MNWAITRYAPKVNPNPKPPVYYNPERTSHTYYTARIPKRLNWRPLRSRRHVARFGLLKWGWPFSEIGFVLAQHFGFKVDKLYDERLECTPNPEGSLGPSTAVTIGDAGVVILPSD